MSRLPYKDHVELLNYILTRLKYVKERNSVIIDLELSHLIERISSDLPIITEQTNENIEIIKDIKKVFDKLP